MGGPRVGTAARLEDRVPMHRRGSGQGWITAEYSMLPRATHDRGAREAIQGRVGGRTHEIQRLIGRSLRAAVDMSKIGERTITLDCDVLQADGGTRTASITGAFAALYVAVKRMKDARMIAELPVRQHLAAVSCGVVEGTPVLDLDYTEGFQASTDLNCVMTEDRGLPALGDDSGIELDALDGFPGIRSARLGPTQKERTAELLSRLHGVPRPWRARFVCVIALAAPNRETQFFEGECRGEVVPEWRGEAGFGYDPIFLVPGTGKTFGEMAPEEKRKYSHRAAAARALLESGALRQLGR